MFSEKICNFLIKKCDCENFLQKLQYKTHTCLIKPKREQFDFFSILTE